MDNHFDIAIVGGGIIGLATANEILRAKKNINIVVLEKSSTVASQQSGHNSGVIHSGIYYKPGSFKAEFCVEGRRTMTEFCEENEIPVEWRQRIKGFIFFDAEFKHISNNKLKILSDDLDDFFGDPRKFFHDNEVADKNSIQYRPSNMENEAPGSVQWVTFEEKDSKPSRAIPMHDPKVVSFQKSTEKAYYGFGFQILNGKSFNLIS